MADIQALKTIYRRLAKQEAGTALTAQKTYLEARFKVAAENMEDGDAVATGISRLGSNSTWLYRGATSEERAQALAGALADIEAEIANAGGSATSSPAPLIMRFGGGGPFEVLQ